MKQTTASGTLALYSFEKKEILVRGSTIDASHKVTLAHELTHVLQDQHFDLTKLSKRAADAKDGDSDAFRALVEGDAVRIENAYEKSLPKVEQQAYVKEQQAQGKRYADDTKDVPDVVPFLFGAPYAFGPSTIEVLNASGGRSAVDDALTGPTPGTTLFIQPGVVEADDPVSAPAVPPGGKLTDPSDLFDAFPLFVMLGMRVDAARALAVADSVSGGRAITFERNKTICYRAAFWVAKLSARAYVGRVFKDWAARHPNVEIDANGLGFTACDPGKAA